MKKDIHPPYHSKTKISCACGQVFEVGSTRENMETEICSACHPFYTGKEKLVDSTGRVDRFKKRMEKSTEMKKLAEEKAKAKKSKIKKSSKKKSSKKSSAK